MPSQTRKTFELRPHDVSGTWSSNDRRYRQYAHELLATLEALCVEVKTKWPVDAGDSIRDRSKHPELWSLARQRDRTSDTVRIYSAMAVEGFLNFYGVLRLGQAAFDEHFERLGLVPKTKALLLVCDSLQIERGDPLIVALEQVARGRNSLVHPKAKELSGHAEGSQAPGALLPDAARDAVKSMEKFFEEFKSAVPASAAHVMEKPVV